MNDRNSRDSESAGEGLAPSIWIGLLVVFALLVPLFLLRIS